MGHLYRIFFQLNTVQYYKWIFSYAFLNNIFCDLLYYSNMAYNTYDIKVSVNYVMVRLLVNSS